MPAYARSLILALLASSFAAGKPLVAQGVEQAAVGFSLRTSRHTLVPAVTPRGDERRGWSRTGRFWARAGLGSLGWVAGAFGGGVLGGSVFRTDCNCDDPGLREAIIGGALGGIAGSTLLAGAPRLGSDCPFGTRLLRGALGATLGTGAGVILARVTEPEFIWLTLPLSTGLGTAATLSGC